MEPPNFGEFPRPTRVKPTFSSGLDFMMGLGKATLHTKFEVASFSHCQLVYGLSTPFTQCHSVRYMYSRVLNCAHTKEIRVVALSCKKKLLKHKINKNKDSFGGICTDITPSLSHVNHTCNIHTSQTGIKQIKLKMIS